MQGPQTSFGSSELLHHLLSTVKRAGSSDRRVQRWASLEGVSKGWGQQRECPRGGVFSQSGQSVEIIEGSGQGLVHLECLG